MANGNEWGGLAEEVEEVEAPGFAGSIGGVEEGELVVPAAPALRPSAEWCGSSTRFLWGP